MTGRFLGTVVVTGLCASAWWSAGSAQGLGGTQASAVQAGAALFREQCADCHGSDAKGVRGPDLTALWAAEGADDRVFRVIRLGVPGSIMPPSSAPDDEIRALVAYLKGLGTAGSSGSAGSGNAANGEQMFWASCGSCHLVNGRGGRLGPDLSRIATSQSREALTRSIRNASAAITTGYEPMILTTRDGQQIRGARKGEDAFSIQIMTMRERLEGHLKADLREVARDKKSLMPDFGPDRLSNLDLEDLLAFLSTLRTDQQPSRRP